MKKLLGVLALVLSVSSLAMADQDTVKKFISLANLDKVIQTKKQIQEMD